MRKIFLLATSALLLIAGCAKEVSDPNGEDGLQEVSFTATMAGEATKAAVDGDGAAAYVNRCIMEIYYDGSLFARDIQPVTHGDKITATFTAKVVANRTYKVAFWADHVTAAASTPTTAELAQDLYYTTNDDGGLQAITLKGTYAGNNDARDAFFSVDDYTIVQTGTACVATLKRPFAQINVITTDWDKVTTVSALKPDKVDVTIQNPLTKFNALTGVASADAGVTSLNYNADLYTAPAPVDPVSTTEKTLSMDYLFAAADKAVIDIAWKAQKTDNTDADHSFANIPYQRNYRTNIKGALLTSQGQWNVTVDPVWETPEADVKYASTLAQAQEIVQTYSTNAVVVNVKQEVITNATTDDIVVLYGTKCLRLILKTTSPEEVGFVLPAFTTEDINRLGTSYWLITYEEGYPTENVTVNAPSSINVIIQAPTSHVEVTGTTYNWITAVTGDNSLVIPEGTTVGNLRVDKGGLEIHGPVAAVSIVPEGSDKVYVRDCENLTDNVYTNLKNWIAEGYAGIYGYTTADKWDVRPTTGYVASIGNVWYQTLAEAVTAATNGQTIKLINDVPAPEEGKGDIYLRFADNVTVDLNGYKLNSGIIAPAVGWDYTKGNAYIFEGEGIIIKNGEINGVERSDGYGYGLYIGNDEDGNIATSNVTVQDVVFPNGGINIYNGSNVTVKDCDITVQPTTYYSVYVCGDGKSASAAINGGTYRAGTNGYVVCSEKASAEGSSASMSISAGTFTGDYIVGTGTSLSITGGTYSVNPGSYVTEGYQAKAQGTDPETWKVVEYVDPYSKTVSSVEALDQALSEFNAAEDEVTYTITLTEGNYALGGKVINQIQKAKKFIIQGTGTVNLNYTGSGGFIFKVHSTSERAINTSVTFKNLKFNSGSAEYAVKFTKEGDSRYVHDISFDHCDFSNSTKTAVGAPDSGHWATGLTFSYCNLVGGSGYLYNGYGVDYSDGNSSKTFLTADHCNTTTSATKTFINAYNEGSIVISNCDITTYNDYTVRSNGGNITVINSKFGSTYTGNETGGILVLRKDKTPTVSVDADTQFNQTSANIHDIYCGDENVTVTITGRETATIGKGQTKNYHDFQ